MSDENPTPSSAGVKRGALESVLGLGGFFLYSHLMKAGLSALGIESVFARAAIMKGALIVVSLLLWIPTRRSLAEMGWCRGKKCRGLVVCAVVACMSMIL